MSGLSLIPSPMQSVFLNGQMIEMDQARISAFDAGMQHGVGLFETMLAVRDVSGGDPTGNPAGDPVAEPDVLWLTEHVDRLVESAKALGLSNDLRKAPLVEAVRHTAREIFRSSSGSGGTGEAAETTGGLDRLRLRLTVTGGDLNLLSRGGPAGGGSAGGGGGYEPTVMVSAQPATAYPEPMYERGIAVTIADTRANPLDPMAGHKTLNYWWRLRELQQASGKGAAEAVVLAVSNHLAGGCVSNLILVKDGEILTPIARGEEEDVGGAASLPSPVLPGVTRAAVLEWAEDAGMKVTRRMLGVPEMLDADEAMLTNASWGVLPVIRLERESVGSGEVGPVARGFIQRWRERLAGE